MARDPIGDVIRNLLALQRVANGITADASELIEQAFAEIIGKIAKHDPTDVAERYRQLRVEKIMDDVTALIAETFDDFVRNVRSDLAEVGAQQARWAASSLRGAAGVAIDITPGAGVGINVFKSIIDRDPFQGLTLGQWAEGVSVQTVQRIRRQIQLGMLNSETLDQIVRRVRGRSAGILRNSDGKALLTKRGGFVHQFEGGVLEATTREAEAIVRTAINWISNDAHMRTYRENEDIISMVEFVAVLDKRTTLICASLDGTKWPVDSPEIRRPPMHFACRSILVPVIDWEGLGIEAPPEGTRASKDGQVSSAVKYEGWLRAQPHAVQDEILGPSRGELFRRGMSLREMVRTDGSVVRLNQLRASGPPAPPSGSLPRSGNAYATSKDAAPVWKVIPQTERDLLNQGNISVEFVPKPIRGGEARGFYNPFEREIKIGPNPREFQLGTLAHETGHAVDNMLGGGATLSFWSTNVPEFAATAGEELINAAKAGHGAAYGQFLATAYGKKRAITMEIFADLYATQRLGFNVRAGMFTPAMLKEIFPRSWEMMEQFLNTP